MFYLNLLDLAHEVDIMRERKNRSRLKNNAFEITDRQFVKTYRLSKSLARSLIDEISPHMPDTLRSDGLDTETKILLALAFYANGSYQTLVGQSQFHAVSQPSVSRAIKQVTDALNKPSIYNKYVKFPCTREDRENIKRGFLKKFGIPGVLGCIDGTHIAIVPPTTHDDCFFNTKGYFSLNTIIICDSDAQIMCVDPSNPGSTHDSVAWTNNPLHSKLNDLITSGEDFYLLGDSEFPLRRSMMTPFHNAAPNTPEAYYTEKHMSTRNVVERCIRILKARFRCLLGTRKLYYKPHIAAKIINACCVLHNILIKQSNLQLDSEDLEMIEQESDKESASTEFITENESSRQPSNLLLQRGLDYQAALVQRLWSSRI